MSQSDRTEPEPAVSPLPSAKAAGWRPQSFVERVGAALVAPRSALAEADEEHASGTAGSDIAMLIGLAFAATYAREITSSLWIAGVESAGAGLRALAGVISRAVAMDLALLFVAGFALTVAAGRKRALGRDFDLVCVAFTPVIAVRLATELFVRASGVTLTDLGHTVIAIVAYGWAGALLLLAWWTARSRAPGVAEAGSAEPGRGTRIVSRSDTLPARPRARGAGFALLGMAALVLGFQVAWMVNHPDRLRPISPGDEAPLFTVPAIDERGVIARERAVSLSELRGRVVIVDFWATWCGPCLASLPAIERVYTRYRERGLEVVSLNMDDPRKARALMRANGYTLPLYADDGWTSEAYKVTSIPHLVIIDRSGLVRHVHRGFDGESTLDGQIAKLLE